MSNSILKSVVARLSKEYPDVQRSTFVTICKNQFKWALIDRKSEVKLCPEAERTLVFLREPDVYIDQLKDLTQKVRDSYSSGVDAIAADPDDELLDKAN